MIGVLFLFLLLCVFYTALFHNSAKFLKKMMKLWNVYEIEATFD